MPYRPVSHLGGHISRLEELSRVPDFQAHFFKIKDNHHVLSVVEVGLQECGKDDLVSLGRENDVFFVLPQVKVLVFSGVLFKLFVFQFLPWRIVKWLEYLEETLELRIDHRMDLVSFYRLLELHRESLGRS